MTLISHSLIVSYHANAPNSYIDNTVLPYHCYTDKAAPAAISILPHDRCVSRAPKS